MRWELILAVVLALSPASGKLVAAETSPDSVLKEGIIARVHFPGTSDIFANPNGAQLKQIADMPESAALRAEIVQKLSTAPYRLIKDRSASTNDCAALLAPLVDELLRSEFYFEARDSARGLPEMLLAVHLDGQQVATAQKNLATALTTWTGLSTESASASGYAGWRLKKHESPNVVECYPAGDWLVIGLGDDDLALMPGVLQRIKDQHRPVAAAKDYWLDAAVDWPALAAHHFGPDWVQLPKMRLVVQGRKSGNQAFLRPELVMQFATPLNLTSQPWQVPTNLIHNPIVSFTAVRSFGSFAKYIPFLAGLNAGTPPDQFYVWAMAQIPYETCFAARMSNASNYLDKLGPALGSLLSAKAARDHMAGQVQWRDHELMDVGLPIVTPYLQEGYGTNSDFLLAGLMPSPRRLLPLPVELMTELNTHPKLVFYSWELTAERLQQWKELIKLYSVVEAPLEQLPPDNTPPQKWLVAVGPKLGNSATEVNATGPAELTAVRNSVLGLSSFDISMLARWVDAPNFPLDDVPAPHPFPLRPPPR